MGKNHRCRVDLRRFIPTFFFYGQVMKSLVIRGHKYGFELLDSVIQFCSSPFLGKNAAESFVTLLHQDDLILSKSSHATVSVSKIYIHVMARTYLFV